MPKATKHHTAPAMSRRDLACGGTALAVSVGVPAAAASPHSDAELLRRCNTYLCEQLRLMSLEDCGGDRAAMLAGYRQTVEAGIANDATLLQVAALAAHTAEGMKAKAEIVRLYFLQAYPRGGATLP